jgi:rhomboid protease GluP
MTLLDEENQKWYCYTDDLLYFADSGQWSDDSRAPRAQTSPRKSLKLSPPKLVPIVTLLLITLNVFIWIIEENRGGSSSLNVLFSMGAIYREALSRGEYWRLISAPFLHGGFEHLLFNMYALTFIGWYLERVYGHVRFLAVYLLSGLAGSILSAVAIPHGIVSVGASGAILGCLAALVLLQSKYSHISFGIGLGSATLSLLYNLVSGFVPGSGIDIAAHFGGVIGGIILALVVSPPSSFFEHIEAQKATMIGEGTTELHAREKRTDQIGPIKESQVVEEHVITTASAHKSVSKTRLLTSVLLLAIAIVSTVYFVYPSVPYTALEANTYLSTLTSTYASYSTYLTDTMVFTTITSETCHKGDCQQRTVAISSNSAFYTNEQVLSTQYNQVTTSSTTSWIETIAPYSIYGLAPTQFGALTLVEFSAIALIILFLLSASRSTSKGTNKKTKSDAAAADRKTRDTRRVSRTQ